MRKISFSKPRSRPASVSSAASSVVSRFLVKGASFTQSEAESLSLVSGYLNLPERVVSQKVWRPHFMCLATREEGGLGLYTLSEVSALGLWKNPQPKLKVQGVLELEEGCEVRPLDASDVPGGPREHCFILVTSKSTLLFQASSTEERSRWLKDLQREIQRDMEAHLLEQKYKLLRKGGKMQWHTLEGPRSTTVSLAEGQLLVGPEAINLDNIESVSAGKDLGSCFSAACFHFNCFVLVLKAGRTVELEAPKQSMRDEWVSALEAAVTATRGSSQRLVKVPLPLDDAPPAAPPPAAAAGVGEFFKQKVKLGAGFPYSQCISFAIETALGGAAAASDKLLPPRVLAEAEFEAVASYPKLELPESSLAQDKKKPVVFEMTEYAPACFRELRMRYEVSDSVFLKSLSRLSGDGAVGDGKSGMLFFFTEDRRYVLKTVKPNEMSVLVDKGMLTGYIKHMLDNPDSLICRFLGLYRFKLGPKGGAREVILVCMQNSFDTRLVLHEKYDLKGSTRNRWCTPRFGSVLKDLNFGNNRLAFDAEDRAAFLRQAEKDSALMESFNVMDYSLLLGIHKPPEEDIQKTQRSLLLLAMAGHLEDRRVPGVGAKSGKPLPTRWQRDFGGVEGRLDGQPQVYIMCIIDILQAYDTGKKLENLIKSQMSEESGKKEISAVNPKTYRERFLQYLDRIILPVDGLNASLAASRRALKLKLSEEEVLVSTPTRRGTVTVKRTPLPTVGEERSGLPPAFALSQAPLPPKQDPRRASSASEATKPRAGTLVDDGDRLKDEIAKAVREAEQSKQVTDGAGASYTEVLEDGTEITVLEEGGFIQVNPDGTVIRAFVDGHMLQTNPDGTVIETGVDGSVLQRMPDGTEIVRDKAQSKEHKVQKNPDGVVIESFPDGSTIQRNPDGTWVEASPDGVRLTHFTNGTLVERLPSGQVTQTNPDGIVIISYPDGRKEQRDPHSGITLTTFKDGSSVQFDSKSNIKIEVDKDGMEKHFLPDGVLITAKGGKTVSKSRWKG